MTPVTLPCRNIAHLLVVVVVVFFTLTDRASTIPSNTRGCQSGTYVICWTEKRSEEHLPSSNESKEKHKHTNDKEIGTGITKYTGQRKINERHSIERVWHSAGRDRGSREFDSFQSRICVISSVTESVGT